MRHLNPALVGLAVSTLGLLKAASQAWLCDDAYISFRYAKNLSQYGDFVFNAGEYVEGVTNLLWTLVIASLVPVLRPEWASTALGLAAYAGVGVLLVRRGTRAGWTLPPSVVVWAVSPMSLDFATSGLETSAVALVVFGAYLVASGEALKERTGWQRGALLGLILFAGTLLRPDALLAGVLLLAVPRDEHWRPVVGSALAVLLLGVCAVSLWRYTYFGDLLPNTFYAKSAADGQLGRGVTFLALHVLMYPALLLCLWGLLRGRHSRALAGAAAFSLVYLAYVAYVGGDFMWGRFIVPVLPVLLIGLDALAARWVVSKRRLVVPLLLGLAFAAPHRYWLESYAFSTYGLVREIAAYPPGTVDVRKEEARLLREQIGEGPWRVGAYGMQIMTYYYADIDYILESESGLTDRDLARRGKRTFGRAGHDKQASLAYLRERNIDFVAAMPSAGIPPQEQGRTCNAPPFAFWVLSERAKKLCQ